MPHYGFDLFTIAGPTEQGSFPPGLNTFEEPTNIRADETPDGYGFDLTVNGKLGKGTIPSGTSRIQKTVTLGTADGEAVASVPYLWEYQRLWNITGRTAAGTSNLLAIGAPLYDARFYYQGADIAFTEDANPILAIIPFGGDSMGVIKTTGSYVISNCSDGRGPMVFQRSAFMQELSATAAAKVCEIDNILAVSNAGGLIAYVGGETKELTEKVRDGLTNFINLNLTVDYPKHRIIAKDGAGTSGFVYDFVTSKIYRFSTSAFRFTTRTFHLPDYSPFSVDRLVFVIEHGDTSDGQIDYQVRFEDEGWSDEYSVYLDYKEDDSQTVVTEQLRDSFSCRRFQVRLTGLTANKYIRAIRLDAAAHNFDDYSK